MLLALRCFVIFPILYAIAAALVGGLLAWLLSRVPTFQTSRWWWAAVVFGFLGLWVGMSSGFRVWDEIQTKAAGRSAIDRGHSLDSKK